MAEGHRDSAQSEPIQKHDRQLLQAHTYYSVKTDKEEAIPFTPRPPTIHVDKPQLPQVKSQFQDNLPTILAKLLQSTTTFEKPVFKFELSKCASEFNIKKLR